LPSLLCIPITVSVVSTSAIPPQKVYPLALYSFRCEHCHGVAQACTRRFLLVIRNCESLYALRSSTLVNKIQYAVYLICVATYNITLHRLAKFPGPKLWAAFHLPHYWEITMGTSSATIKSLHDKYGEVVRVSPKSLSFASGQAWRGMSTIS
jgi:hypothetical protein